MASIPFSQPAVLVLTADRAELHGTTWDYRISDDAADYQFDAYMEIPSMRIPYPCLRDHGYIDYVFTGKYVNPTADQDLTIQLVVDGSGSGTEHAFTVTHHSDSTAMQVACEMRLFVVGSAGGASESFIRITLTCTVDSTVVFTGTSWADTTSDLDPTTDHTVGFQVKLTTASGTHQLDLQSFTAIITAPSKLL